MTKNDFFKNIFLFLESEILQEVVAACRAWVTYDYALTWNELTIS